MCRPFMTLWCMHFMGKWTILPSEIKFLIQSDRQSYLFSLPSSTANTTIATASIRILVGYRQFKNCIQQCILTFTFGPLKISCVTYDLGWDSIFMTDQKPCCYTLHSPQWFEMIENSILQNFSKIIWLAGPKKLAWKSSPFWLEPERQRLMAKVAWNFAL